MNNFFLKKSLALILVLMLLFTVACDSKVDNKNQSTTGAESSVETSSDLETNTDEKSFSESDRSSEEITEEQTEPETESQSSTETEEETTENISETHTESDTETVSETVSETESEKETETLDAVDEASRDEFYGDSDPADSYEEAIDRATRGEIAGADTVPDQAPTISEYRPSVDGVYVKNVHPYYIDENTYVVVNAYGQEVLRVYRGGGYITLEEVAAYIYAFGEPPANHSSSKRTNPKDSIWGEYLRVNNTKFSGNTTRYPYEPVLPRINGCGGDLQYWEMDIGTTGNDCDPSYSPRIYNNGTTIVRGASRIVYTWNDLNNNGITDSTDIVYVFYTYNHYNDFQEYLNYFGGWGDMFGNITGGGEISSKTNYNPTPYVPVYNGSLVDNNTTETTNDAYVISVILPTDLYYMNKYRIA